MRILLFALSLIVAACAAEPGDVPRAIATGWCQRHAPGDAACLQTAREAHLRCLLDDGADYDTCRTRLLHEGTAANP